MSKHALLSPSSSHRWLHCTPSAKLESKFENKSSRAAEEGTLAHLWCEYKLRKALGRECELPTDSNDNASMQEHTDAYVDFVLEQFDKAKEQSKDPLLLIEQHLDFSAYVPDGYGTADTVIVSDDTLYIIDFKYGMGVLVDAMHNPQMQCYALGALAIYDCLYDIKTISISIFQPRRENVSTWTIPVSELIEWAEDVLKPKALMAINGEGEFFPGDWCTFCRASIKCRARAEEKLQLAQDEFKLPPVLSDKEIADILLLLPGLTKWGNEIMSYATDAALNHGKEWKGFKLVEGRSIRKYKDEETVAKIAKDAGFTNIYRQALIPLTEMQKLMGKTQFEDILGDFIIKPPGKPTLVPSSDKRPAIHIMNANTEFNTED